MLLNLSCLASWSNWKRMDSDVVIVAPADLIRYCNSEHIHVYIFFFNHHLQQWQCLSRDSFVMRHHQPKHEHHSYSQATQEQFEVHRHDSMMMILFRRDLTTHQLLTSIPNKITDFVLFSFKKSATLGTYMLNFVFSRQIAASDISNSDTVFPNATCTLLIQYLFVFIVFYL
jgi:hypothetical protein